MGIKQTTFSPLNNFIFKQHTGYLEHLVLHFLAGCSYHRNGLTENISGLETGNRPMTKAWYIAQQPSRTMWRPGWAIVFGIY